MIRWPTMQMRRSSERMRATDFDVEPISPNSPNTACRGGTSNPNPRLTPNLRQFHWQKWTAWFGNAIEICKAVISDGSMELLGQSHEDPSWQKSPGWWNCIHNLGVVSAEQDPDSGYRRLNAVNNSLAVLDRIIRLGQDSHACKVPSSRQPYSTP